MSEKKILFYLNQFFGQIGGEEKAGNPPIFKKGGVGPSEAFEKLLDGARVVGTVICGDNYFNENKNEALEFLREVYKKEVPDIVVAGPAFNAGRYGMACAGVAELFSKEFEIPVVTGMYDENPGVDVSKPISYVIRTKDSAATMREALKSIAAVCNKLIDFKELSPDEDGYFPQGRRLTVFSEKTGAKRAVETLMKRLNNMDFDTELPMPVFDKVDPARAIKDMKNAVIALVTTGGIVPLGNPDKIQSASAQKWGRYDISKLDRLTGDYCTIHGGYDPVYANECPDRVVPLDSLKNLEKSGDIGGVYKYFYTTTGTGTAVGNSIKFGREIGKELKEANVDGVILTST